MESPAYALTLAFTTFVLFQFFNVFNARAEHSSVFNVNFFRNGKLWLALAGVLALQVMAVHWPHAQTIFGTTDLQVNDWLRAAAVASSMTPALRSQRYAARCWLHTAESKTFLPLAGGHNDGFIFMREEWVAVLAEFSRKHIEADQALLRESACDVLVTPPGMMPKP